MQVALVSPGRRLLTAVNGYNAAQRDELPFGEAAGRRKP